MIVLTRLTLMLYMDMGEAVVELKELLHNCLWPRHSQRQFQYHHRHH